MQVQRRTQLAWLLFLATFGCLAGGLVVTLFVTRPLTSDVLLTGAFDGAIWLLFATLGLVLTPAPARQPDRLAVRRRRAGLDPDVPWDPWVDQLQRTGRPLPPAARLAALAGDSLWAVGSAWPSPCRCCCCRSGGCGRAAGGWSPSPPWSAPPCWWWAGPCRRPR